MVKWTLVGIWAGMLGCLGGIARGQSSAPPRNWTPETFEFREGRWLEMPTTAPAAPVDEPALDQAESLLAQKQPAAAKKILLAWEKDHKKSPVRDRCILLLADVFYQQDDHTKAFFYCDELMDEYPESKLFPAALQKQYDIAYEYMNGYKDSFLGMHILDMGSEAVQMMWRIQQRSPGSPLAQKGMLATAFYYYNDRQYDLAEDAFNAYAKTYPNDEQIPVVRLKAAFASLAQFRGTKFDASSIIDARQQLMAIQRDYPALAAQENVATVLERIDSAFAAKLLEQGKFYQKTGQPKGAVYMYRFLVDTYPESPEAGVARKSLDGMPRTDLAEAGPPAAPGFAPAAEYASVSPPTTQPAEATAARSQSRGPDDLNPVLK
jgi:outer membrane protein assembly factor BamD (BamD/ComL family)